ncbi:MAG: MarR family transcriptional regulator [Pyrobaculum sp.]|nr:MarR family transcriptional regulator [Pyrobaculum sp.]
MWPLLALIAVTGAVIYITLKLFKPVKTPARREAEVEAAVLAELIRGGPLAPAQIAERTGLDIGEVVAALQRLRREGLVDAVEKDGGVLYLWTGRR